MNFVYPEFLWALLALSIPIIIHLFHFRRYKTLFFSSTKFIQQLEQQSKSTKKLKHLMVLILRGLALSCLIFAFAQPYSPVEKNKQSGGKPVIAIYLDNSFSMTAKGTEGELLSEGREIARKIITDADIETRFLLTTNYMNGLEQRLITKIEALDKLDKIKPIALNRNLDGVLNWQKNFLDQQHANNEKISSRQYIVLSDFQKNTAKFNELQSDENAYYYPILLKSQDQSNIFIDSIWFDSPIQKLGENNTLNVKISNSGGNTPINTELHFQTTGIKRDVFLQVPPSGSITTTINYTDNKPGSKIGKLTLNDKQVFWDDDFYFSYFIDDKTNILIINGENANSSIERIYSLEKHYKSTAIAENSFTLNQLDKKDLVVLNGLNQIGSGMSDQLVSFVQSGGTLALIPGEKIEFNSWNQLLNKLKMPLLSGTTTSGLKIDNIQFQDPFFKEVFEKKKEKIQFPSLNQVYRVTKNQNVSSIDLIGLQNGQGLLQKSLNPLSVFLLNSPLSTNDIFTKDALFVASILRIGEMSQRKAPYFLTLGKEAFYPLYRKQIGESPIHLKTQKTDFIPQTKTQGLIQYISLNGLEALENLAAGTFDIVDDQKLGNLSLNYDRIESDMNCLDKQEIKSNLNDKNIKNITFTQVNNGHSLVKIDLEKPFEYWKLFLIFGVLFLLGEMAILKLWK